MCLLIITVFSGEQCGPWASFFNVVCIFTVKRYDKKQLDAWSQGREYISGCASDELLRSSSKLKRILKSSIGENIQVLDANKEIANVYERFTDVIDQAFKAIKEKIDAVNTNCREIKC